MLNAKLKYPFGSAMNLFKQVITMLIIPKAIIKAIKEDTIISLVILKSIFLSL